MWRQILRALCNPTEWSGESRLRDRELSSRMLVWVKADGPPIAGGIIGER